MGAPLLWMLLVWFAGLVWFPLWLLALALFFLVRPFRPLRESRFMYSLGKSRFMQPGRSKHP